MIFIVNGQPKGKSRARTFYDKRINKMRSITPEQTKSYEELIRWCYKASGGEYLGDKPISLTIKAYYEIPKSFSKSKRLQALQGQLRPLVKPDIDNVCKSVLDALNGVAYYDDKQVISVVCEKWYAEKGCLEIEVKNNIWKALIYLGKWEIAQVVISL